MARRGRPPSVPPEDVLAVLKSLGEAGVVLGVLAFVGGWSYMAAYYRAFGLSPFEVDFSIPAICALAIHMLYNAVWPVLLGGLVLAAFAFLYAKVRTARRTWIGASVVVLVSIVAAAGTLRGRALARQDMFEKSSGLPNVGFVTKSKQHEPSCLAEGTKDCKLLLHAKGLYYFRNRSGLGEVSECGKCRGFGEVLTYTPRLHKNPGVT